MKVAINKFEEGSLSSQFAVLDNIPDVCPICHHAGELKFLTNEVNLEEPGTYLTRRLQIVVQCQRTKCKKYSIAYYKPDSSNYAQFSLSEQLPKKHSPSSYSKSISGVSEQFVLIYGQSEEAESKGLDKIAGVGYRKALEFLIKDYIISKNPDNADKIKSKSLGNCIRDDVSDVNVQTVGKRAVWLGNDETHYVKIWNDKDISDLKNLIQLCVHWIESEILTAELIVDMPEKTA